ncbi:MAG: T9SS type A sorting domain-containing protein [Ferruginibacter sp.]|nr:T9SS type A sorting domain-containing protein [Ferruginibacter sp.]
MKKTLKPLMLIGMSLIAVQGLLAQSIPTIEMPRLPNVLGNSNYGVGSSISPVVTEFKNDNLNNNVFTNYVPQSTFSVSFANQQFTGLSYGTANYNGTGVSTLQSTGLVFGIGPSLVTDPAPQGGNPYSRYNIIGEYGGNGGPTNSMFTSNPTATGAQLGTGINVANASNNNLNGAVEVFTTAQVLYNNPAYPVGSRAYFGDLVLTFNQPVKNPVIHIAGLGGSYRYLPFGAANVPANYVSTFFSTELELQTPGLTSTLMSSNQFMTLSGNNILNNNDVNPNGGSINDPTEFINNLGAATGSIRINGTVQTLVYRVYLQGGTASQFAWSAPGSLVLGPGAPRDPFTGDIWYVAASYDRPTLQIITGNVFNDADGLADNNVSKTLTSVGPVDNPKTNAGGLVYANLISGGVVVATMPVAANGTFLFDNVAVGTYTVQISSNQGVVGQPQPATALPSGWVNTGEFNGAGAGNDGAVNGLSAPIVVVAGDIKSDINFGIERLPDSKSFNTVITTPVVGESIALTTPSAQRFGPLPILTGSDPEDQPTEGVLTGKSVQFTTLATVGTSNTPAVLMYNGVPITLNQVIPNFNPALLTVSLPNPWAGSGLRFNYAFVDAAGLPDPTPALYRLSWSGGGTLEINLSEFIVTKNNCTANLNWKTSSEINSDRFEIEVSTSTNPVYSKVSTVLASGTSSTTKSYQFSYPMQTGLVYYFRLKMIDKNGSFTYSTIQSASCSKGRGVITIGPNPATDYFTIRGMQDGKNSVMVYASNGQLVKGQEFQQNQGDVNISHLAPGMYTVKVTNLISETTVVLKLIKY